MLTATGIGKGQWGENGDVEHCICCDFVEMSQLPVRENTFCGCCSDAQKCAINSISQALELRQGFGS